MRGPWAVWFVAAALAGCGGCRSNCHLVESELRTREMQVRELREELDGIRAHNQALEIELRALRGDGCTVLPGPGPVPAIIPPAYPVRSLSLGRQTGGHPSDCGAGDDALQVLAEPRDAEGQAVKVPGSALLVQAIEITSEGIKRPLSSWEVPPEQLRNSWRSGLLSTGYTLTLPWKVPPSTDKLRVVAQLRLPDGRVYEADKDITVRLPPHAARPILPPATPVPPPPTTLPPAGQPQGPMLPPAGTEGVPGAGSPWHTGTPGPAVEVLRPVALDKDR
jgi:hypothetical protein